jgi:aldose 1-epimerase
MDPQPAPFGVLSDGRTATAVRLARPGGLVLDLLDYGAIVRGLSVPSAGGRVETVLGLSSLAEYEADRSYHGCVVGRCANRIAGAHFTIDGQGFDVAANEGPNCLHGGPLGFSRRLWRFVEAAEDGRSAALAYDSADGEEGFPGRVRARVVFALEAADTLTIAWEAETDRPTPVNLTHHLYFNLSGEPSRPALDHTLAIAAGHITPVRPDLIPTGELMAVDGTPFDLRTPRRLGEVLAQRHPQLAIAGGIDHNWALDAGAGAAVVLRSPGSGLSLSLSTDQPGIQVYSGQGLKPPFAAHGGIALEPQGFPDAVNQPNFPYVVLRPGQAYRRRASYRFTAGDPDPGP